MRFWLVQWTLPQVGIYWTAQSQQFPLLCASRFPSALKMSLSSSKIRMRRFGDARVWESKRGQFDTFAVYWTCYELFFNVNSISKVSLSKAGWKDLEVQQRAYKLLLTATSMGWMYLYVLLPTFNVISWCRPVVLSFCHFVILSSCYPVICPFVSVSICFIANKLLSCSAF